MKVELQRHFKEGLPEKVGGLVKEAEKEIDDQNLRLKIADEFGYRAMDLPRRKRRKSRPSGRRRRRGRRKLRAEVVFEALATEASAPGTRIPTHG